MGRKSPWATVDIFNRSRKYKHPGEDERGCTKKRIGFYTFQFHNDGSGVTIQADTYGFVTDTWILNLPTMSSPEKMVANHWHVLALMQCNAINLLQHKLNVLAGIEQPDKTEID